MNKKLVLDLFSGGGGLALGAVQAGFEIAASVDIDTDVTATHCANFPGVPVVLADLMEATPEEILAKCGRDASEISGVLGGPPCQGFSHIGRRDPKDPRNNLVGRFFDFVSEIRPQFFVFENVPGILLEEYGGLLKNALSRLPREYSVVGPCLLDAADYGAPTRRRRVVILGFLGNLGVTEQDLINPGCPGRNVRDAITDLPVPSDAEMDEDGLCWAPYPEIEGVIADYATAMRAPPRDGLASEKSRTALFKGMISGLQPTQHSDAVRSRFQSVPEGAREPTSKFPRLSWEKPAPTLRAGTGRDRGSFQAVRPIHPRDDRVISVREAARLQGFPDWFQFHHTKWHSFRMIGNSVSPIMAEGVLGRVADAFGALE